MDRNRARICVSVCGRTAGEFLERLKLAENSAPDLIELRFDCLGQDEFEQVEIAFNEKYIAVFRPKDQGGAREINIEDRRDFWNSVPDFCGADLE